MTELNEITNNWVKNGVNEKVREAFNRYHKISQETFQKILADKDDKHQEVINILTSQLLASKAERDEHLNKLNDTEQLLEVNNRKIEALNIELKAKTKETELRDIKIETLNRDIENLATKHSRISELESEVARLSNLNERIDVSLNKADEKIEALRNINKKIEEDKHKLFLEKLSMEGKISNIDENCNNKIFEIKELLQRQIFGLKDSYELKILDIKQASDSNLSQCRLQVDALESELQNIHKLLQESENQRIKYYNESVSCQNHIKVLIESNNSIKLSNSDLESHNNDLEKQISELKFEKENLDKKFVETKSKNYENEKLISELKRDSKEKEKIFTDEINALNKMLEESIELAERLLKEKNSH